MRAPCLVDALKQFYIQKIECGDNFTFAVSNKTLYTWGQNNFGQLGQGHQEESVNRPTAIQNFEAFIEEISCG
jgi:alpha-tubulin suppressor-like RCC1 family protein